jgi:hypothetical protein
VGNGNFVKMDSGDYEIKNLDIFSCGEGSGCFISVQQELQRYRSSLLPGATSELPLLDTRHFDLDRPESVLPAIPCPHKRSRTTPRKDATM